MTRLRQTSKCFLKLLCVLIGVLLACVSISSCKSAVPAVQVLEKNVHDTIVVIDTKFDSISRTDSVYEYVYIKGDTVIRDRLKYETKYKYSTKHDSVYVNNTDTIELPVYIEKSLTKSQKFKIKYWWPVAYACLFSVGLLILMIACYIRRKSV